MRGGVRFIMPEDEYSFNSSLTQADQGKGCDPAGGAARGIRLSPGSGRPPAPVVKASRTIRVGPAGMRSRVRLALK